MPSGDCLDRTRFDRISIPHVRPKPLVQTAYEALVAAVRRESTNIDATNAARAVTNGRLIGDVTIRFKPLDVSGVPRGARITVTPEMLGSAARRLRSNLLDVGSISASATMVKE